ncbi:helix-turn-helix domain-containing protein [Sorangium sp. So ce124]|uniref:helix-turn-helix domain-containing protein n=1 Tax=Sorangium sp. So ce124 TaxID=3133280 RepID=UPI003F624F26
MGRTRGSVMLAALGLDQVEIARRCGVVRSAVGHWATGRSRPNGDMRCLLARVYKIPVEAWIEPANSTAAPAAPSAIGRFIA